MTAPHLSPGEIARWVEEGKSQASPPGAHVASCPPCAAEAAAHERFTARAAVRAAALLAPPHRTFERAGPGGAPGDRAGYRRERGEGATGHGPITIRRLAWKIVTPAAAAALLLALGPRLFSPGAVVARDADSGAELRFGTSVATEARAGMRLRFSDGTVVRLDRSTRISRLRERGFFLESGRAHVATAGGPGFSVEVASGRVEDIGTVFLVEARGAAPQVTVVRGTARVIPASGAPVELSSRETAAVAPGARAAAVAVEERLAWVRDALFPAVLKDEPLSKVFGILEEIGTYRIEAPPAVREFRVTGSVEGVSTEGILRSLAGIAGAEVRIEGDWARFLKER